MSREGYFIATGQKSPRFWYFILIPFPSRCNFHAGIRMVSADSSFCMGWSNYWTGQLFLLNILSHSDWSAENRNCPDRWADRERKKPSWSIRRTCSLQRVFSHAQTVSALRKMSPPCNPCKYFLVMLHSFLLVLLILKQSTSIFVPCQCFALRWIQIVSLLKEWPT